jgi:hypothetical protein
MVVPGTNCSQKIFENFFGPIKGDLQYRDKLAIYPGTWQFKIAKNIIF